ncbi:putative inorganic phosphate cotransporter [Neodiprion virginianus]|uniref:putative inorganic phosphate cotransporter n=1 Tax=Neodiprion virginianus TaxID=2961670 RepID=UPI001EE76307|nr:putative inorganic phosphate cotransporter [Neodiprion virginianus]
MFSTWKICCARIPQRWVLTVMGCFGMMNVYTMRICLSLAITEMVATTEASKNDISYESCPSANFTSSNITSSESKDGTYEWDEYTQGIILSSFYWGYLITSVPGGILADRFGGKYILGIAVLSTAVLTLLTPLVVKYYEATGLIVFRFLTGVSQGSTVPAISVLIAQWAPPQERSKLVTVAASGMEVGCVLGTVLSGFLIRYSSIGWPMVFYVYGGMGVLWFLAWILLCYSEPDVHPFITEAERTYLHEMTIEHTHKKTGPTPWRQILTSAPVWALIAGEMGFSWGFYMVLTDLPKYMNDVLKFSIQANGLLTSLPFAVIWLDGIASSWLADWLIEAGKMSRTNVRKICTVSGSLFPAIFVLAASYAECDRVMAVVFFTVGIGFMGSFYPGIMVNPLDLSPNYSGTLTAIVNGSGALAGILAPYAVGVLTPNQTLLEWRIVFWITSSILVATSTIYGLCADGEVQYWNDSEFVSNHRWKDTGIHAEQRRVRNDDLSPHKHDR